MSGGEYKYCERSPRFSIELVSNPLALSSNPLHLLTESQRCGRLPSFSYHWQRRPSLRSAPSLIFSSPTLSCPQTALSASKYLHTVVGLLLTVSCLALCLLRAFTLDRLLLERRLVRFLALVGFFVKKMLQGDNFRINVTDLLTDGNMLKSTSIV